MKGLGYIADFNQADGLPPLVVQKLNNNFRSVGGFSGRTVVQEGSGDATSDDAFSNVKVGNVVLEATATERTLELAGSNVTLTPAAPDRLVTIGITDSDVTGALGNTPVARAAADANGDAIASMYAKLASPALTGAPTAPTAAAGTDSTQIATTAFVQNALAGWSGGGSVTGVKGDKENVYRTGDVNITAADIGAVPFSNDEATIKISNSNIERGVLPSSSIYGSGGGRLILSDKNNSQMGYFQPMQLTDGTEGVQVGTGLADGSAYNTLQLAFDSNDNATVGVSHAAAWRDALGITDSGWQTLTLGSAAKAYDSNTAPVYRKCFNVVNLVGAVSPKSQVTAGGSFTVGQLPSGYRPKLRCCILCQGSGNSAYLLSIETNGNIEIGRYRNGASANAAMSTTTWLPFNATFICA